MSDIARFMHAYVRFVHDKPRRLQISSFNVCYRFESCVIRPTRNTLYCPPDPGSQGLTGNHTTSVTRNAATCIRGGWITRNTVPCLTCNLETTPTKNGETACSGICEKLLQIYASQITQTCSWRNGKWLPLPNDTARLVNII